jgi:hypothetical protein
MRKRAEEVDGPKSQCLYVESREAAHRVLWAMQRGSKGRIMANAEPILQRICLYITRNSLNSTRLMNILGVCLKGSIKKVHKVSKKCLAGEIKQKKRPRVRWASTWV